MVSITCLCGFTADCGAFIDRFKVDRWLRCPNCEIKFSSPNSVHEIGVQVIKGKIRSEISPADPVERELREWRRDCAKQSKERQLEIVRVGRELQGSLRF